MTSGGEAAGGGEPAGPRRFAGMRAGTALLAILLLALALRLGTAAAWAPEVVADAADYDRLARHLVAGDGFVNPRGEPTSWRPPGYPLFVAGVYEVAGASAGAVRWSQAVVGTGSVALAYAVGALASGPGVGLVAAAIVALDPAQISSVSRLLSEALFTFLLLAATALLLLARRRRGRGAVLAAVGAGAVLGAGVLTRGWLILYPALVAGALLVTRRRGEPVGGIGGWGRAAALLLAFGVVLLPWTLRNHRVHDAFVPVSTQVGAGFYAAQNPPGGYVMGVLPDDEVTRAAAELPEPEASRALLRAGLDSLAADPAGAARTELLKLLYLVVPLDWEVLPGYGAFNPGWAFVALWTLIALYLRFLSRAPDRSGSPTFPGWPVWLPALYLVWIALVFYGSPRLRLPVEPLLAVVAAYGIVSLARSRGGRRAWTAVLGTVAVLLCIAAAVDPLKAALRSFLVDRGLWG